MGSLLLYVAVFCVAVEAVFCHMKGSVFIDRYVSQTTFYERGRT